MDGQYRSKGVIAANMKKLWRTLKKHRRELSGFLLGIVVSAASFGTFMAINNSHTPLGYEGRVTVSWLPASVARWSPDIERWAKKYDLNADFVAIIMTLESGGNPKADSGVAKGLLQVTDYTAKDIASKYLITPQKTYDLYDPQTSIEFGVSYLAHLRNVFCDQSDGPNWNTCVEIIAAGYNGGPGAANSLFKGEGLLDDQTVIYSRNAFNMWREKHAQTSPTFERWKMAGGERLIGK